MNQYITGKMIKRLREERRITQLQLAEKLKVSDKAISRWETGRGYPDITMIESLAAALGVSVIELFSGQDVANTNKSFNLRKTKMYVCPICGNIIQSTGEAVISCCGISLPVLEADPTDAAHAYNIQKFEDEFYITIDHEMSKSHYISFIGAARDNGYEIIKLYPEGDAQARFKIGGITEIYYFCNRHGLFKISI